MASYTHLSAGEPAPTFRAATATNPRFAFDTTAGRWLVMGFFGDGARPGVSEALSAIDAARGDAFNDNHAAFFGVSNTPADAARLKDRVPGMRFFHDFDGAVSRLYGALPREADDTTPRPLWVVIDPTMRIRHIQPMAPDLSDVAQIITLTRALPEPGLYAGFEVQAPILILPGVFEPELCEHLIGLYQAEGGQESGFMREIDGKTVGVQDKSHKVRKDINLNDPELIAKLQSRVLRRVVPEIKKVHQFTVTRMERYIVSCYAADDGGHFNAHRDNTTSGTAHRRFAVSINLNDAFDGGEVSFPEYGPRSFKAPAGGAVVFSCSLLHKVSKVTRGERYAFLPFLYDDAAAALREANNARLSEGVGQYKSAKEA